MSAITLETIKQEQDKLNAMIADFEAAHNSRAIEIDSLTIELNPGEQYAGMILDDNGNPAHHLILLPDEAIGVDWGDAKKWAKKAGGELPTRQEQALLYANLKRHFEGTSYWSCEQHAANSSLAWCQHFIHGYQNDYRKDIELRARAVRRLSI